MTLRHMKIFVSVYQNNGITRASEELHLAQPSVSLAIRELEDYYGIRLFDRISRRLYVTEQGKMFYDYALHIVSLFDEMELGIRNWEHMGTLRIGSSITIGNFLLPGLIKKFTTAHPNMNVKASVHNSSYIEESILKQPDRLRPDRRNSGITPNYPGPLHERPPLPDLRHVPSSRFEKYGFAV